MDVIILFITRFFVYGLGGFIAYKKRMWWIMAVCISFMAIASLSTFFRQESRPIIAILSNFSAFFLVMTVLRSTTERKPDSIVKIDTLVTNQQVDTQIIDNQTVNNKE